MLHDDGDVRFEYRRVVGVARNRVRLFEIVETQVERAPGGNRHAIGTDRLAVGKKDCDRDVRIAIPGVENARGLV
jgi:hypothetical protein